MVLIGLSTIVAQIADKYPDKPKSAGADGEDDIQKNSSSAGTIIISAHGRFPPHPFYVCESCDQVLVWFLLLFPQVRFLYGLFVRPVFVPLPILQRPFVFSLLQKALDFHL